MAWRLANSLTRLRDQVNAAYPNRNKASDGTIGNAAHAASASDHNPNSAGVVCALDLTHDPANGFDAHAMADRLRANRHPNLRYIISNSRIASAGTGWGWSPYGGSNPHSKHVHISVGNPTTTTGDGRSSSNYDDGSDWNIRGNTSPSPQPTPNPTPRKSNEVIASEVIAGAWGSGDVRRRKLDLAGYNYAAIQAIVNQRLAHPRSSRVTLSGNAQIADQVINGAWGSGADRKARLQRAGYNYAVIQALVNQKLGAGTAAPARKSPDQVANEVITGRWGSGEERKSRLTAAGYDYRVVQSIVNRKLGY